MLLWQSVVASGRLCIWGGIALTVHRVFCCAELPRRQSTWVVSICFCCSTRSPMRKGAVERGVMKPCTPMPSCLGMLSQGNETKCLCIAVSMDKIHLQVGRSSSTCI